MHSKLRLLVDFKDERFWIEPGYMVTPTQFEEVYTTFQLKGFTIIRCEYTYEPQR